MRLKEIRTKAGLSQQKVADYMNVTQNAYSYWELGRNKIDSESLKKLSALFGVSVDYILGLSDSVQITDPVFSEDFLDMSRYLLDANDIQLTDLSEGEFFALRINDSSMEPRMKYGDIVIVRKQSDIASGNTAVILINKDVLITRVIKTEAGIILSPTNPDYQPVLYTPEIIDELHLEVIGKVVELRAKY